MSEIKSEVLSIVNGTVDRLLEVYQRIANEDCLGDMMHFLDSIDVDYGQDNDDIRRAFHYNYPEFVARCLNSSRYTYVNKYHSTIDIKS